MNSGLRLGDLRRALAIAEASYAGSAEAHTEGLATLGIEEVHVVEARNSRAIVTYNEILGELAIGFAGTDDFFDVLYCTYAMPIFPHIGDDVEDGYIHRGFWDALQLLWEPLLAVIDDVRARHQVDYYLITGHSLGGAMAHIAAMRLRGLPIAAITFGMPRVGCRHWVRAIENRVPLMVRVVHDLDDIPTVPGYPYKHAGKLLHLDSDGKLIGFAGSFLRMLLHRVQGLLRYPKSGVADHLLIRYRKILDKMTPAWRYPT